MICWISSSSCDRASSWSPSAGSPSNRSIVSSGSTPPLKSASRIASCSACIVRSSSLWPCGLPKPLDSSRSDSFETRSSRSSSSSASPVNFVYRYFNPSPQSPAPSSQSPAPSPQDLVVILFLPRRHPDLLVDRRLLAPGAASGRGRLPRRVAALFAAADFLLRVQSFEDEVDRRGDRRRGSPWREASVRRQLAEPLDAARLTDPVVSRRAVAQRQRAAEVEPFDHRARVDSVE